MVNESTIKSISAALSLLCEANGVSSNLEVRNYCDNECDVIIPAEIANEKPDALDKIRGELENLPAVESIYDRGAGRVIEGDDFRQFEITVKDGCWSHSDADDKAADDAMKAFLDKHSADKLNQERKKNWKDFLLPLPDPDGSANTELYLTMSYEPYDWIDVGYMEDGKRKFKTEEFRSYNEYYAKKLLSHPVKTVKFQRGYGGPGRAKPKQMRFKVTGIKMWDPTNNLICDPRKPVEGIVPQFFVIQLGERL